MNPDPKFRLQVRFATVQLERSPTLTGWPPLPFAQLVSPVALVPIKNLEIRACVVAQGINVEKVIDKLLESVPPMRG